MDLERWGLIYKHSESPELYPIYLVDRMLTKFEFINELRNMYGGSYDSLGDVQKNVLNVIYHLNKYSQNIRDINAAQIGDILYFRQHKKITDVNAYNEFKRKIRRIINSLTEKKYLNKSDDSRPMYTVNKAFKRTASLFD